MSFFFQAEDGIRDLVRSRGLGDVYKRQVPESSDLFETAIREQVGVAIAESDSIIFLVDVKNLSLIHI